MIAAPLLRRATGALLAAVLLGAGLVAVDVRPALASYPVPPTPRGLPAAIEDIEPYIGQSTCNPVAKPGVVAFRNLLLRTYPDSGSLGIVRDCGAGGQSEHKEGRAFDWRMSVHNARQRGEVSALLTWLTKSDANGNRAAMARRLGIMYMIWNRHIWKVYDSRGWLPYSGESAHTDHVHFSFGWNGAWKRTSYWDGTVAPIDFGPHPPRRATPVRSVANLTTVRTYGGKTLAIPTTGTAVKLVQAKFGLPADGDYGSDTAAAVALFQVDHHLRPTQQFGPAEWKLMFPPPVIPFGAIDTSRSSLGNLVVTGWAIDADTTGPIDVTAVLDGTAVETAPAAISRDDVARSFPQFGSTHGFGFLVPATDGPHQLCLIAHNAPGSLGSDASLGCRTVSLQHDPVGALESVRPTLGVVHVTGYALDPDTTSAVTTALTVDGVPSVTPSDALRTDISARWPGIGDDHGVTADLQLSEGPHTVCLTALNVIGTEGTDSALGCRTVTVPHSPVGAVTIRRAPGGVLLDGWGVDPDIAGPVDVQLVSDGAVVATTSATTTVAAVAAAWPDQGSQHGFHQVLDLPVGSHLVCARLLNAAGTPGTDLALPCRTVVVSHDPSGVLSALRDVPGGTVLVSGSGYDPDVLGAITVTPTVDGRPATTLTASGVTSQLWPGYGTRHAFAARLRAAAGSHRFCLTLENAPGTPGSRHLLGCRTLVVHSAVGALTSVGRSGRIATVHGWALDPDTVAATRASVVVDGRVRVTVLAGGVRTDVPVLMPQYGSRHGYGVSVALTRGTHRICVVARNVAGTLGSSRTVGCRTLTVT